ncbi:hypothetical protein KP509_20G054500 [Ceratopteris richardii]|uniref:DUF7138 domain-containing protein n=1 Tax=Ceratopteris richardii TaxID=49495 RepID=A0A8T2SG62_CERRI|nr:hypothetical protein KP509_20G054500 [Ceratopteris richardii]KAH7331867.1 hypothetical protein KP509_20G054500 [Ceratopteris richardii]KAH7331868.1 hypothetical protein KP509_20G054500 [Ceratopteris richardii]KAH7331869.1 hypothetical protein KP509_20G054500 [Ceratopteris richardii]
MESFATPYPLIFSDGEQEHDKGFVGIHSALTFKRFQSLLSQKTGVPYSQLSTVFVCRKALKGLEKRQRLPINGNTNFAILLNQHNPNKERDCYFLVSLKRSKKERKVSRKRGAESDMPDGWEVNNDTPAEEGRGHIRNLSMEEVLSQGSTGSNHSSEINGLHLKSPLTHQFTETGVDISKVVDNKATKGLLKRGSHPLLKHGWNHGEPKHTQRSGAFVGNEHIQLNSPRFAALRPEDQREINWKWEEAFPRVKSHEQREFHGPSPLSHGMDANYPLYNHEILPMPIAEEMAGHRNGQLVNVYDHNYLKHGMSGDPPIYKPVRSREFLHFKHSKPSFLGPRASHHSAFSIKCQENVQKKQAGALDGHSSQSLFMLEEDQQNTFAASTPLTAMLDLTDVKCGFNKDIIQGHYCKLCFECRVKNVMPIPFHSCVEDIVVNGFRGPSPAGPIGRRPKSRHIEAAA